jgi:glyoxylate/hydroxypyruvate reductase
VGTSDRLNVLIASYLEPELVEQIRSEVPEANVMYHPALLGKPRYVADHTAIPDRTADQETQWQSLLVQADVLFDFDVSHREDLPQLAPNLKWIQATSAGIGQFVKQMGYAEQADWVFTTASGVHARPLAEFAMMAMLMFAKDYPYLRAEQDSRHWQRYCATELAGRTAGVIGLGKIGREVARLAKAFDMRVVGNRRHPEKDRLSHVDVLFGPDELASILEQAEFLVLATPHTAETEKMIGGTELGLLPRGAVLINIARGSVVDEAALIEALHSGQIGGAALDVFEVEPLPTDSPLWSMPNVLISPHSASTANSENRKLTRLFCDNLKRFLAGQELVNVLDVDRLY